MKEQEIIQKVLPFLKAYKNSLSSDWGLHPVQAVNAVYIAPEQVLRNSADAIESKRKMEYALDELIKELTPSTL